MSVLPEQTAQADQSDLRRPWTIKNISPEISNAATAAAKRSDQTVGEWLSRVILAAIKAEGQENRQPAVIEAAPDPQPFNWDEVHIVISVLERIAHIDGSPIPPTLLRSTHRLIRSRLNRLAASDRPPETPHAS